MRTLKWIVGPVVGVAGLVVLILWVAGVFATGRVPPGRVATTAEAVPAGEVVRAERVSVPVWYEAVGSFRSRSRVTISAQITGRVVSVTVREGDEIAADRTEPLIHLDDAEFQARLNQARQTLEGALASQQKAQAALAAANARDTQATRTYERTRKLWSEKAVTDAELEAAESSHLQAQAGVAQAKQAILAAEAQVERARQVVKEATVALGYTTIGASKGVNGVVAARHVDPGDLAWPGKALLVIHDPARLRLEAFVREGLIGRLKRGQTLTVVATALGRELEGTVDEIVPFVDPKSRSLLVKVVVPTTAGLFPGMFGKLRLKLGERETVLVPAEAVLRVGQLEMVYAAEDGGGGGGRRWARRLITTGAASGNRVEVLSGVAGGEALLVPSAGGKP